MDCVRGGDLRLRRIIKIGGEAYEEEKYRYNRQVGIAAVLTVIMTPGKNGAFLEPDDRSW
jgi:hypothetical protein